MERLRDPATQTAATIAGIPMLVSVTAFSFAGGLWVHKQYATANGLFAVGSLFGALAIIWIIICARSLLSTKGSDTGPPSRLVRLLRNVSRIRVMLKPIAVPEKSHTTPALEPMSPELVQFLNAWLMPTFEKALQILVAIRGTVQSNRGDLIAGLLQDAVIEPAAKARSAVQTRLGGHGTDAVDPLAAEMYRQYELVARRIRDVGGMVNWFGPVHLLADWRKDDGKLMDRLRDLVNLPGLGAPTLYTAFKDNDDSGIGKIVRSDIDKVIQDDKAQTTRRYQ